MSYEVTFDETVTTTAHGAIPAEEQPDTVVDDPTGDVGTAFATGIGVTLHTIAGPGRDATFAGEFVRQRDRWRGRPRSVRSWGPAANWWD